MRILFQVQLRNILWAWPALEPPELDTGVAWRNIPVWLDIVFHAVNVQIILAKVYFRKMF